MFKHPTIVVLGFVVVTLLGADSSCTATSTIRDDGDFFSESALSEATRKISEMEKKYKKDLVVETFKDVLS